MEEINLIIINLLKKGYSQKQISAELQEQGIKPNSLSSVEKYIKCIKQIYQANTMFHLACILHDQDILVKSEK